MSDDIVREFLVESNENLDSLDRELVLLEKNPSSRDTLASVFRTIHTIKGTCGFLGFTKLESVAHVGENLLSRLRDGELTLNPEITTALLRMVDAIRQMLTRVEASGSEGERDDAELIKTLTRLQQGAGQRASKGTPGKPADLIPQRAVGAEQATGAQESTAFEPGADAARELVPEIAAKQETGKAETGEERRAWKFTANKAKSMGKARATRNRHNPPAAAGLAKAPSESTLACWTS